MIDKIAHHLRAIQHNSNLPSITQSYIYDKYKQQLSFWINDESVNECYTCYKQFGTFIRKHHCRLCGRIFCYNCCNNWRFIDDSLIINGNTKKQNTSDLLDKFINYKNGTERVCKECDKILNEKKEIDFVLLIFNYLTINEIKKMATVSKKWLNAVINYLTVFKRIQYKYCEPLTQYELQLLHSNKKLLYGHSKWMFYLIKYNMISDNQMPMINPSLTRASCKNVMCASHCSYKLESYEIMQLLMCNNVVSNIRQHLFDMLCKTDVNELYCYTPLLSTLLSLHDEHLLQFINTIDNLKINFEIQWNVTKNRLLTIFETINETNYYCIISRHSDALEQFFLLLNNKKLESIDYANITIFKSKNFPILIPLLFNTNGCVERKKIMFKRDNLIKDYIVCKIVKLITYMLRKRNVIKFDYICYDVHLLSSTTGFIEIVDDAETLFNLQNKYNTTILDYIVNNNPHKSIKELQSIFVDSLAVYSVISYLLGIGDRHLNNIMVHKSGIIFHIDFGYILGQEPKFKTSDIRLTDDMLNTFGGIKSNNYIVFKNKCSEIFNFCRKMTGIIHCLLSLLVSHTELNLDKQKILDEVLTRFEPNEKYIDASQHIKTIVDNSHDKITTNIIDAIYKMKQWLL